MQRDRLKQTLLTRLKRARNRGHFDRETIYSVIDSTPMCHLGYMVDDQPAVIPTIQWREGDHIYWHGSRLSRALINAEQQKVCLTVTQFDGMVLARSAFHHSANYRCAMIFGQPERVEDKDQKTAHLKTMLDGLFPDRWDSLRPMTRKELNATTVLRLPIEEGAAKIREGDPNDAPEELGLPIWAGVIPLETRVGKPIPSEDLQAGIPVPKHVKKYQFTHKR